MPDALSALSPVPPLAHLATGFANTARKRTMSDADVVNNRTLVEAAGVEPC
jgi:hypothetical protein